MSAGSTAAVGRGVHFFLSYAHGPRQSRGDDPLDKQVRDFFGDLSDEVARLLGLPRGAPVGFADWQIRTGRYWRQELGRVLGTCGAFVPLCTPRYFESEMCGQEWAAFRRREHRHQAHTKEGKSAIIPVIWTRMDDEHMPPAARRIHYLLPDAGEIYRKRAMRELVMRSGNREEIRDAYRTALTAFADYIVEVAQTGPLSAKDDGVLELNPEENAFEDEWSPSAPRPLRFVVVAPVRGKLPARANPEMYGNSPELWRPYRPADEAPIAATAAMLAETDDFHPFTEFLGACPDLLDGAEPSAPTVLIVDPWAAQDPELADLLRAFDTISHDKPWVRLVIPWDKNGSGDGGQVYELEQGLQRALYQTRSQCRITNPEAVAGLPTVAAFGERLPGVIAAAEKGYFRSTATRLPLAAPRRLPQLGAAAPENGPSDGRTYRRWETR
jgi:FxsC-like protein